MPATQIADLYQRIDLVGHQLRINEVLQGKLTSENIPTAEYGTVDKIFCLMDLSIGTNVISIHIRIAAGIDHRVVQTGIKYSFIPFTLSLHFDTW